MKNLISLLIGFIAIVLMSSCRNSGNGSNAESQKVLFSCVLYEDNNGELKNSNGERVCAVRVYSRGEPMNLNFSTEVDWQGLEIKEVYLKNGNVYTEYPSSSKIEELIPIATYNMYTKGAEMNFDFFASASEEQMKDASLAKQKEREEQEAKKEQARLEKERNTWNGAETLEELETKLNGTIWHSQPNSRYGGIMYKFVFDNGSIKRYSARGEDGEWSDDAVYFSSYTVEQKRDTQGNNFIQVSFGDLDSDIDHAPQQIVFIDKCKTVAWFINGNPAGMLTFGDYTWSDSL